MLKQGEIVVDASLRILPLIYCLILTTSRLTKVKTKKDSLTSKESFLFGRVVFCLIS